MGEGGTSATLTRVVVEVSLPKNAISQANSSLSTPCTQAEGGDGGGAKAEARDTTSNVETQLTVRSHSVHTTGSSVRWSEHSKCPSEIPYV